MKLRLTAAVCMFIWPALLSAQSPTYAKLDFDLAHIGAVLGGKRVCEDKGRLQDYSSRVMEQIIEAGPKAIPVLIRKITDARAAGTHTDEPVICYWYGMAIGDIAFCTLLDLFTDSTHGKTTMPGAGWTDMLGPDDKQPAWEQFNDFISKHGRKVLQAKWQKLWNQNSNQIYWDTKERCFRLKGSK